MADLTDSIPGGTSASPDFAAKYFWAAHVWQLYFLWQSGNLLVNFAVQNKGKEMTAAQLAAFQKQIDVTKKVAVNWGVDQKLIEDKGGIKLPVTVTDLFSAAGLAKIKAVLNKLTSQPIQGPGIGFVPLIIGGVILIIALWGVYEIVKRFTVTVDDRKELLKTTQETAAALGLTPQQAADLLTTTQTEATKSAGGLEEMIKWAIGGFLLVKAISAFGGSNTRTAAA